MLGQELECINGKQPYSRKNTPFQNLNVSPGSESFPKDKKLKKNLKKSKTQCWMVQNKHLHLGVHEAVGATLRICVGRMPADSRWLLFYFIA